MVDQFQQLSINFCPVSFEFVSPDGPLQNVITKFLFVLSILREPHLNLSQGRDLIVNDALMKSIANDEGNVYVGSRGSGTIFDFHEIECKLMKYT